MPISENFFQAIIFRYSINHFCRETSTILFYHCNVLLIIMGREKKFSCIQLTNYTTNRPYITYLIPFKALENNLWRSILAGIDDSTVILIIFGGSSKIYDSYLISSRNKIFISICLFSSFIISSCL